MQVLGEQGTNGTGTAPSGDSGRDLHAGDRRPGRRRGARVRARVRARARALSGRSQRRHRTGTENPVTSAAVEAADPSSPESATGAVEGPVMAGVDGLPGPLLSGAPDDEVRAIDLSDRPRLIHRSESDQDFDAVLTGPALADVTAPPPVGPGQTDPDRSEVARIESEGTADLAARDLTGGDLAFPTSPAGPELADAGRHDPHLAGTGTSRTDPDPDEAGGNRSAAGPTTARPTGEPAGGQGRAEAGLAATLATAAAFAALATSASPQIWLLVAALPAIGLIGLLFPAGDLVRLVRATGILGVAAVWPLLQPSMTPVTLVVALAVAATYPLMVRTGVGRLITALAICALTAPLAVAVLANLVLAWSPGADTSAGPLVTGPIQVGPVHAGPVRIGALSAGPVYLGHPLTEGTRSLLRFLPDLDGDPTGMGRVALGSGVLVTAMLGFGAVTTRRSAAWASTAAARTTEPVGDGTPGGGPASAGTTGTAPRGNGFDGADALGRDELRAAVAMMLASGERHRQQAVRPTTAGETGVVVIDVDRFAGITDTLGRAGAAEVTAQVAGRLKHGLASLSDRAVLARTSGHRFAIAIADATAQSCTDLARRITALVGTPVTVDGRHLDITCSMGGSLSGPALRADHGLEAGHRGQAEDLIRFAEQAVRTAQQGGRSRWVLGDRPVTTTTATIATSDNDTAGLDAGNVGDEPAESPRGRQAGQVPGGTAMLEQELRDALRHQMIEVTFQPLLALGPHVPGPHGLVGADAGADDDRVVGVEAQPVWKRADGTRVEADILLPLADELGVGDAIGMHVIRQALGALITWRHEGAEVEQVWVDIIGPQLDDLDFAHEVAAQLAIRGLAPSTLVLQIGSARLVETERSMNTLGLLRSLGIAVALDDFGRNGTSLSALDRLPVSAVKLDPGLTTELGRHDEVARAGTGLCHSLGLRVVIEGIGTMEQLRGARAIGADAVQGPLIAGPMSAGDVTDLLTRTLPRTLRLRPAAAGPMGC